jgi:hypothetical protein
MSKEQIEELADDIYTNCPACLLTEEAEMIARFVVEEQGYRKQAWISVEERLPEREGKYLAYTIRGTIEMAGCYSYYVNDKPQFDYRITHWMPLPAPPKGGEG